MRRGDLVGQLLGRCAVVDDQGRERQAGEVAAVVLPSGLIHPLSQAVADDATAVDDADEADKLLRETIGVLTGRTPSAYWVATNE